MPLPSPLVKTLALVTIENQDKILVLNHQIIGTAEADEGYEAGLALENVAKSLAEATGVTLSWIDTQVPPMEDWNFEDVLETLPPYRVDGDSSETDTYFALIRVDVTKSNPLADASEVSAMIDKLINVGVSDALSTIEDPDLDSADALLTAYSTFHEAECV